jgi:RNA polymerase sigma-32 factor
MDRRLRGDLSLNLRTHDESEGSEVLERLVDPSPTHDVTLGEDQELAQRRERLKAALEKLSPREKRIFTARYLTDDPPKLETLALEYGISRERVRQIERRSFEKVQSAMVVSQP